MIGASCVERAHGRHRPQRGDLSVAAAAQPRLRHWWVVAATLLVILRLFFHAVYSPVFEGPDEPFHLGRVVVFARGLGAAAWQGRELPPEIVAAIRSVPCGPDLSRAFGCERFGASPAAFNILTRIATAPSAERSVAPNYEAHQPPLWYLLAGTLLRAASAAWHGFETDVTAQLLMVRLLAVACVAAALLGPLRPIAVGHEGVLAVALLLLLLVPGASESLARCANDAAVFLWSAVVMAAIFRRSRTPVLVALVTLGPLLKLTAFPVVAVVLAWLWRERGRASALLGAAAAGVVVVVQAARGWAWGGTVELNVFRAMQPHSWLDTGVGLARSLYTFAKTTVWLGGWSVFRPPAWWLGVLVALVAWLVLSIRKRVERPLPTPHLFGLAVAGVGVLVFAFGQRRLFGEWGGLGGWYAWGWFPWLFTAAVETFEVPPDLEKSTLAVVALFGVLTNCLWFASAGGIYGWP